MTGLKLSNEEIVDLEDKIFDAYDGSFSDILNHINTKGKIEEFLRLIDHEDLLGKTESYFDPFKYGTIVVLGASKLRVNDVIRALRDVGIKKERIELHLEYDLGGYKVEKSIRWNSFVSLVLVGPIPHSLEGKGNYNSIIEKMEREQGYPPVIRLLNDGKPKITKTNLKEAIRTAVAMEYITI